MTLVHLGMPFLKAIQTGWFHVLGTLMVGSDGPMGRFISRSGIRAHLGHYLQSHQH
jgi:hypothetical protein